MNEQLSSNMIIQNAVRKFGEVRNNRVTRLIFTKQNMTALLISIFMGRASLLGQFMPFGFALYAAATGLEVNKAFMAVGLTFGMISVGAVDQIFISLSAMVLFKTFGLIINYEDGKAKLKHALVSFVSVFIPGIIVVYLDGLLMYDLFKLIFFSCMVFCLVFIFKYFLTTLTESSRSGYYSNEELISLTIAAAVLISGLGNIYIAGTSVMNILCIFVILSLGHKFGAGVGSALGVAMGLIISLTAAKNPEIIASYAFCGLLAGVFKNLGKTGSILGFVLGNAILTFHINGSTEVLIHIKEILPAVIIFLLIPARLLGIVSGICEKASVKLVGDKKNYAKKIREMTVDKLKKFSNAFICLAKTYDEIAEAKPVSNKQDVSILLDRVADKVCKNCSLCRHCWDRNFYSTYQSFFSIVEILEMKGWVAREDVPNYLLERCERINSFVNEANSLYEVLKVNTVWKNKINESREMLSQQLSGLSKIITGLATEISIEESFKGDLEYLIKDKLKESGIKAEDVTVYENKWGKYEIEISNSNKECQEARENISLIEKIVSTATGRKMRKNGSRSGKKSSDMFVLRLMEEEVLSVTMGVSMKPKSGMFKSGDSYTFFNTGESKFIAALSDGMGSGEGAAIQSNTVIKLLEELVDSGFDTDTTINIINSILLMKSNEESFATIDLSIIDLYDGDVEFVKIGAAPTYIKKDDMVKIIKTISLPAGILGSVETELMHFNVEDGDFIIMMTDGIYDSFYENVVDGFILEDFLSELESRNPQEIADDVLNKALAVSGGKSRDDMLVLAAKVWSGHRS